MPPRLGRGGAALTAASLTTWRDTHAPERRAARDAPGRTGACAARIRLDLPRRGCEFVHHDPAPNPNKPSSGDYCCARALPSPELPVPVPGARDVHCL